MHRRKFVQLGSGIAAAAIPIKLSGSENTGTGSARTNRHVDFIHDGLLLSPVEYAELLMKLADEGKIRPDYYSIGGVVEELEDKFARLLGKEAAIFLPTGTLANHIAVRRLAGNNRRVILQERSHLYHDSGDCCQTLSGLNLIPLGNNAVEISRSEIEEIIRKTNSGRVETKIGVISIETPVRRQSDRMFGYDNLKAITGFATENGIKTHLDGARIFVQAVHENRDPADYGKLFDTVYTSMWKCFNTGSGAILAGSKDFTAKLFHERRMFGGGLPASWAFAAVALHFADTFLNDYKTAWQHAEQLLSLIQKEERFSVVRYENGSHVFRLNMAGTNLVRFREALINKDIELPAPDEKGFLLKINPSLNRISPQSLAGFFLESLKEQN